MTIAAPNGTQPIWAFAETEPAGTAKVAIAYAKQTPSDLLLPVVPGVKVPTGLPPCPGLRGEPCRGYVPLKNPEEVRPGRLGGDPGRLWPPPRRPGREDLRGAWRNLGRGGHASVAARSHLSGHIPVNCERTPTPTGPRRASSHLS